jgi:hypothetical protein
MSQTLPVPPLKDALGRLGLSHAALAASIVKELEQARTGPVDTTLASAVAHAIEANNAEVLRQLTIALRDLERHRLGPPPESD